MEKPAQPTQQSIIPDRPSTYQPADLNVQPMHEWEQQPNETTPQYKAFLFYLNLPTEKRGIHQSYREYRVARGLDRAKTEKLKAPGRWVTWCTENKWEYRARRKDYHDSEKEQRELTRILWERNKKELEELSEIYLDWLRKMMVVNIKICDNFVKEENPKASEFLAACRAGVLVSGVIERVLGVSDTYADRFFRQELKEITGKELST